MSKRTLIRNEIKNLLINAPTTCGDNVYSNRVSAYWRDELPSISIFTTEENAEPRDIRSNQYVRTMNLMFEVHAEASEDLDQLLDTIADEIEDVMVANQSIGGHAIGSTYTSSSSELTGDATKPIGVLTINYEIKYIR